VYLNLEFAQAALDAIEFDNPRMKGVKEYMIFFSL